MALQNFTGFDAQTSVEYFAVTGTARYSTSVVHTAGGASLRCDMSEDAAADRYFNLGTPLLVAGAWANAYVTIYFYLTTSPGTTCRILMDGSSNCVLKLRTDDKLEIFNSTTSIAVTASAIPKNEWVRLDMRMQRSTTGAYELRVNGVTVLSGTGNFGTAANVASVIVGKRDTSATGLWYFDDWLIDDAAFTTATNVGLLLPNGNGAGTAWTNDYTAVDEAPPYSQTDFIEASSNNVAETFTFTDISTTVSILCAYAGHISTRFSGTGTATFTIRCRPSSVNTDQGATSLTALGWRGTLFATNPETSLAWTPAQLNGAELGLVFSGSGTRTGRTYWMCVQVAYNSTQTVTLAGVASAEALGDPAIIQTQFLSPAAIASSEAFGDPAIIQTQFLSPPSIASAEAFGDPVFSPGAVSLLLEAIASLEAFGVSTLTQTGPPAQTLLPVAIGSDEAIGAQAITGGGGAAPTDIRNVGTWHNGAYASASSTTASYLPSSANNNTRNNLGWGGGSKHSGGWNAGAGFPQWYQIEFLGEYPITEINVITVADAYNSDHSIYTLDDTFTLYGIVNFEVQYWDGSAWVAIPGGTVTGNNKIWRQFLFSPILTRGVRIWATVGVDTYARLAEVEVIGSLTDGTNVAGAIEGAVASASSSIGAAYAAAWAIDGSRNSYGWEVGGADVGWAGENASFPSWLRVDFAAPETIARIEVVTLSDNHYPLVQLPFPSLTEPATLFGIKDFEIQYWDGSAWTPITGGVVTGNDKARRQFIFSPITTPAIRLYITAVNSGATNVPVISFEAWTPAISGPGADQSIVPSSIETLEAFGAHLLTIGAVNVSPAGIASLEAFGAASIPLDSLNVAFAGNGGIASASSTNALYPVSNINNGNWDNYPPGTSSGLWQGWNDATIDTFPDWVVIEFDAVYSVYLINLVTLHDATATSHPKESLTLSDTFTLYGIVDFKIEYWDGDSWETIPGTEIIGNNKIWSQFTFSPISTNKIRVWITGAGPAGGFIYSRIIEVEAWTVAASGAVQNLSPTAIASLEEVSAPALIPGAVNLLLASVASAEAMGVPTFQSGQTFVQPSGVASAEAFGLASLLPGFVSVLLSAIASAEGFGNQSILPGAVAIQPASIPSAEAYGAHQIAAFKILLLSAIASSEAFGAPIIQRGSVIVAPPGVASLEAFGLASFSMGAVTILLSAIASAEAFGTNTLQVGIRLIQLPSIASLEIFGAPVVIPGLVTLSPPGALTGEAFGAPSVLATKTLLASGIASLEAFGALAILRSAYLLLPPSIASLETFGAPSVSVGGVSLRPPAIVSAEAFGDFTVIAGARVVAPSSIPSAEALGEPSLQRGAIFVLPAGILTAEACGNSFVLPGAVTIQMFSIASAEAMGLARLRFTSVPLWIDEKTLHPIWLDEATHRITWLDEKTLVPIWLDEKENDMIAAEEDLKKLVAGNLWAFRRTYPKLPVGATVSICYFTIKASLEQEDNDAGVIQVDINTTASVRGVIEDATTDPDGKIVVFFRIDESLTKSLIQGHVYHYSIRAITTDGDPHDLQRGTLTVVKVATSAQE